jgi:phosphate:Na+ symporter
MEIILLALGGLGLFLFAINNLSSLLKSLLGKQARKWLGYCTKNIFAAILTGCLVTILLDSSSAVIIMTIVLINAKALTFRQSLGVVMGANVGTTFSSQLIALDIGQWSPIPIFLGLILSFFVKNERISTPARVLLYFGILFFGLYTMERAVEPLRDRPNFLSWMTQLENPAKGAGIGALVTLIIQSSSATVGMVITLAKKAIITLPAGIAVMLGAELGTCSDTLLATIRSDRQAIKTGLFHLFFNFTSICIGLSLFGWYVQFVEAISYGAQVQQKIANAHIIFNSAGVVIFLPFLSTIEKQLNKLLPDKERNTRVPPMATA